MSNEVAVKRKMEVSYKDLNDNDIRLNPAIIKKYLTTNPNVTDQEVAMFMKLCEMQRLNPFLREVYLVKYSNYPATFITGKETFLKRARRDEGYAGHKAWCDGKVPDMTATAEVFIKGFESPICVTVDYEEYVGMKGNEPNKMWKTKPKTMLRKVALVQALREAFPDTFGGLYSQEEISSVDMESLPERPVDVSKDVDIEASGPPYKKEEVVEVEEVKPPEPVKVAEEVAEAPVEDDGGVAMEVMPDDMISGVKAGFYALSPLFSDQWFDRMVPTPSTSDRPDFMKLYKAVNDQRVEISDVSNAVSLDEAMLLIK